MSFKKTYWCGLALLIFNGGIVRTSQGEDIIPPEDKPALTRVFWRHHENNFKGYTAEDLGKAIGVTPFIFRKDAKLPELPTLSNGMVLHRFPGPTGDDQFIRSATGQEPALEWEKYKARLVEKMGQDWKFEDIDQEWDIEGKWIEAQFLGKVAPNMSAPETHLMKSFDPQSVSAEERSRIETEVKATMEKWKLEGDDASQKLFKVEAYRRLIHNSQGKSIVKPCFSCGSFGNLPWTDENWLEIYGEYLYDLKNNPDDTSRRGWALTRVLDNPHRAITQKGIDLKQEVRVHVLNGHVIKGATFIRYSKVTDTLPSEEIERIETAVEKHFLKNLRALGPDFEKFNATPDVAIGPDGRFYIIDLNAGIDSGFYHPNLDIMTANLMTQQLTGKSTPFLDAWKKFKAIPMGKDKIKELVKIRKAYPKFTTTEYNQHAQLWDRITNHYYDLLKANPSPENFELALLDFRAGGLRDLDLWAKFLNEVHQFIPIKDGSQLLLPEAHRQMWADHLNRISKDYYTITDENRITVTDADQPANVIEALKRQKGICPLYRLAKKRHFRN